MPIPVPGVNIARLITAILKDKQVLRVYRNSQKFPFITAKLKATAPVGSVVHKKAHVEGATCEPTECVPEIWIELEPGKKKPELFEQVMWQREGYAMLMLTLVWADEDAEDEERLIERNWRVSLHR